MKWVGLFLNVGWLFEVCRWRQRWQLLQGRDWWGILRGCSKTLLQGSVGHPKTIILCFGMLSYLGEFLVCVLEDIFHFCCSIYVIYFHSLFVYQYIWLWLDKPFLVSFLIWIAVQMIRHGMEVSNPVTEAFAGREFCWIVDFFFFNLLVCVCSYYYYKG